MRPGRGQGQAVLSPVVRVAGRGGHEVPGLIGVQQAPGAGLGGGVGPAEEGADGDSQAFFVCLVSRSVLLVRTLLSRSDLRKMATVCVHI